MANSNFYSGITTGSSEIDLRTEFFNTMYGKGPEIAKHQKGLQRVFRHTSDGSSILCECVDSVTKEPDKETRCPICLGEGKLWDESSLDFYHIRTGETGNTNQDKQKAPGIVNTELEVFYIPFQFDLTKGDKIVTLLLDKEGKTVVPLTRFQLFRISELRPMRLDNGRLEFWKAFTYEDNTKFL
jgi:hypothetical protein